MQILHTHQRRFFLRDGGSRLTRPKQRAADDQLDGAQRGADGGCLSLTELVEWKVDATLQSTFGIGLRAAVAHQDEHDRQPTASVWRA